MSTRAWTRLLDGVCLPAAVVDLAAFDANTRAIGQLAGATPIRIATKSVRCVDLLRRARDRLGTRYGGLMAVSPREALFLAERGFRDLLVAYPVARHADAHPLVDLAALGASCPIVVDCPAHISLLADLASAHGITLSVMVDLDLSWRPLSGLHLGVRRSPVRSAFDVVELVAEIVRHEGLSFDGVLAYEAQVAGVPDRTGSPRDAAVRLIKSRSRMLALRRRTEVVHALTEAGFPPRIVNGGGTGSVAFTAADPACTEVTAGSALLAPHSFDGFDGLSLRPSAFVALPVSRRSDPGHITVHGGGYPASGAPGPDRLPQVVVPEGLRATSIEGFGEVQTPLVGPAARDLDLGDVVLVRHAKAGELFERFSKVLVSDGGEPLRGVLTYRGEGLDVG